MIPLGGQAPHARCTPMGRTCGEPDEIGLAAMGVELNGSGRVHRIKRISICAKFLPMQSRGAYLPGGIQ